jgi:arylsulfatase A-like enzyme
MIKKYFKIYALLVLGMSFTANFYAQTAGTKPNVIVILADDLGYGDVGFNRDGSFPSDLGIIPTPNLDALASNGIICKNAHVAHPFCGPSRVAIMTGMLPHRIGAQYNLPNDITTTLGVPTNETYFPKLIQKTVANPNGYKTAAFGKWHLGFVDGSYQPLDRGFDYFFGFLGGGKAYFENGYETNFYNRLGGSNPVTNEYQDPLWRDRAYVNQNEFSNAVDEDYLTDILTDDAISYISTNGGDTNPFFMYLSYNAPHTPLQAPAAEIAQFKIDHPSFEDLVRNSTYITESNQVTKWPVDEQPAKIEGFVEDRIIYATMVTNMDTNIGRVVAELKKDMNVFNNTVIIFLSDNGGYTYSKGAVNYPLAALKGSVNEGGHKVPMFVHWPAQITSGTTYNHQISSMDLYPTIVNLAGATIPAEKIVDGVDFMDDLIAGNDARPNESLLIMRPYNGFHNGGVASGQWKIVKTGNGSWRLYNILADPGETIDLRGTEPNAEQIIQDILDQVIALVTDFKDVKPAWYDNDDGGAGHPHSFLWDDGTLPGYDRLFETDALLLESEISEISVTATTDAVEGEVDGVFTVSLPQSFLAGEDITVSYTVSGDAIEGTDYTALSGTVKIFNGTHESQIIIDAPTDGLDETSETVTITLQSTDVGTVNTTPADISVFDAIAPVTLTAGDIAIVGWKGEGPGKGAIAFMLLKDISATTKISISNRSWKGTQDGWTGNYSVDDVWTWTAGASFSVGDIFKLDSDGQVKYVSGDAEVAVGFMSHDHTGKDIEISDGDFDMTNAGDGILIYQEDPFVLPTDPNSSAWITGMNTNGTWGLGSGNTFCALPTALTNGTNANAVSNDHDNGKYIGALVGTASQLRASINNPSNWTTDEDVNYNLWSFSKTVSSVIGEIGSAGSLGIEDILKSQLSIFPNPSSDFFNLNFNKPINKLEIEILSMTGKSVRKVQGTNTNKPRIDVSNLAQGMYLLRVKADDVVSIEKILKI